MNDDLDLALDDEPIDPGPDYGALASGLPTTIDAIAELDSVEFAQLAATAVRFAREAPSDDWLIRLRAVRTQSIERNQPDALAMILRATAQVAEALGRDEVRIDALEAMVGVRDLRKDKVRAHAALLELARALADAGEAGQAEVKLHQALTRARDYAPGGNLHEATELMVRALVALGRFLGDQGRHDEAREWLEGAIDLAPGDPDALAAIDALG